MKPTVKVALENLIKEARLKIPFNLSFEGTCDGRCDQCPYKRMEWLDIDLGDWESRLKRGEVPTYRDLEAVAKNCRQVYDILYKEGYINDSKS